MPSVEEMSTGFDHARAVADAVLYEGYLLYPYRQSSPKNQVRWQFGILAPRPWIEARGPVTDGVAGSTESWWQQTECLIEAPAAATLHVRPRYLQLQAKAVERRLPDGTFEPVERLELGDGRAELAFDEAVPQEADVVTTVDELRTGEREVVFGASGSEVVEPAHDQHGQEVGRIIRRRWPVAARLRLSVATAPTPFPAYRLRVRLENTDDTTDPQTPRPTVLRHSLIATHSFVAMNTGSFLSLLDPPAWAAGATKECANVRTFPVLAGPQPSRDLILSSPIILYDHPEVAPESPGDLHDATEIDELLTLYTHTLTDEEKREARSTDPRAAAIVDRVDSMPPEVMERLHGAVRSLRPTPAKPSPDTDAVVIDGVPVAKGSRVRLHPRQRGTDAHDMFLAGMTAVVEAVFLDVDDSQHVAVSLEDDPNAEVHQWYGRFYYFAPEEVEPLPPEQEVAR